jgi:hypothetical protein
MEIIQDMVEDTQKMSNPVVGSESLFKSETIRDAIHVLTPDCSCKASVIREFEDVSNEFERAFHSKPASLVFCPLPVQFGFSFSSFRAISNIPFFSFNPSRSITTFLSSRFPAQNFVLTNTGVIIALSPVPTSHAVYIFCCISIFHLVVHRVLNTTLERLRKTSLTSYKQQSPLFCL